MTREADYKKIIRARMARTGENYTTARSALEASPPPEHPDASGPLPGSPEFLAARSEQERVVSRFIVDGRIVQVPMRRRARAAVLLELVALFAPGHSWSEPQVNEILGALHDDVAFWRRELVNYGYLTREGGIYRLAGAAPVRPSHMMQEIPAWEAAWLPGHLAGKDR